MSRFTAVTLLFVSAAFVSVGCCLSRRACHTCQPCHDPCGCPTCGPPACETCGSCGPDPQACCAGCGPSCGGGCHRPMCGGCGSGHRCGKHFPVLRKLLRCLCDDCNGCGEIYWGPFHSDPPDYCDPCDHCGNWIGRGGPLQAPYHAPQGWGAPMDAGWSGVDAMEEPVLVSESEQAGPRHNGPLAHRRRAARHH